MSPLVRQTALVLRNDLRLLWRVWRTRKWRAMTGVVLLAAVLAGLHGVSIVFFASSPGHPPILENLLWIFFGFLMLGAAMNQAIALFFDRADFDLLLSSPVDMRAVLAARLTTITLVAFAGPALLLLPLINGAAIGLSPRYFAGYAVWFLLATITACVGVGLTFVLVRWLGPRRARIWVQIAAALFGASIYLLLQFNPAASGGVAVQRALRFLNTPAVSFVSEAARGGVSQLLLLGALSAGAVALTTRKLARIFSNGLQESVTRPTRTPRAAAAHRFNTGLVRATFRKDLRLILRDPLLLSQLLPSAVFLIPLIGGIGFSAGGMVKTLPLLSVVLAGHFSIILSAVAASGEEGWDLIRASPASKLHVRLAKLAAGMAIPVAVVLPLLVVEALMGEPWIALLALVTLLAISAGCCWLEVAAIRPSPRHDIVRQQGRNKSLLRSAVQMTLLGTASVGIGLFGHDSMLLGTGVLGIAALGVIACFTLVEIEDVDTA